MRKNCRHTLIRLRTLGEFTAQVTSNLGVGDYFTFVCPLGPASAALGVEFASEGAMEVAARSLRATKQFRVRQMPGRGKPILLVTAR